MGEIADDHEQYMLQEIEERGYFLSEYDIFESREEFKGVDRNWYERLKRNSAMRHEGRQGQGK